MAKERKDLTALYVSEINRCRPKKTEGGTFEFAMSDKNIFGDVKYVLLTGNEPFDTFTGGFPFGRISEVYGLENCGKSALMIRAMCRFQAKHIYEVVGKNGFIYALKRVDPSNIRLIRAYIDNEGSLEKGFKLGIEDVTFDENGKEVIEEIMLDKIGVGLTDTIEHVFLAYDKFMKVMAVAEAENEEEERDEVIFGAFIVDTVAGTSSKDEIKKDWGERDYPRAAQQISEGFRRLRAETVRHNIAAIFTNQVRKAFNEHQGGGKYRPKFATPQSEDFSTYGGKALAFYATHRIFMFQVPIKYTLVKGSQFAAGFLIGFKTVKNRLRKPLREGRMVLLFDEQHGGLHNILGLLETLIFLKVAELHEDGSVTFLFRKYEIETTTFAENVKFNGDGEGKPETRAPRSRRKPKDPEIDGRYQWISFYKAHRPDIEKLWQVAVEKANKVEGLDEFYQPEAGEDGDPDPEDAPPRRPRTPIPQTLEDPDLS